MPGICFSLNFKNESTTISLIVNCRNNWQKLTYFEFMVCLPLVSKIDCNIMRKTGVIIKHGKLNQVQL